MNDRRPRMLPPKGEQSPRGRRHERIVGVRRHKLQVDEVVRALVTGLCARMKLLSDLMVQRQNGNGVWHRKAQFGEKGGDLSGKVRLQWLTCGGLEFGVADLDNHGREWFPVVGQLHRVRPHDVGRGHLS